MIFQFFMKIEMKFLNWFFILTCNICFSCSIVELQFIIRKDQPNQIRRSNTHTQEGSDYWRNKNTHNQNRSNSGKGKGSTSTQLIKKTQVDPILEYHTSSLDYHSRSIERIHAKNREERTSK